MRSACARRYRLYRLADVDRGAEIDRARTALAGIEVAVLGRDEPLVVERLLERLRAGVEFLYVVCHGVLIRQVPRLYLQGEMAVAPPPVPEGEWSRMKRSELRRSISSQGFFKSRLAAIDKAELVEVVEEYRLGCVPLVVPLTLFRHHLRYHEVPGWLRRQTYLNPYPRELMLRNHV